MTDKQTAGVTRRELFLVGNALAMPVLLGGARARAEGMAEAGPLTPGPQIYQSIGVEPIINCRGTFTIIGGSVERPEVPPTRTTVAQLAPADRAARNDDTYPALEQISLIAVK